MTRFIFITGGVVSSLGKGHRVVGARRAFTGARLQGPPAQARSLSQRRSRHDEPDAARRGLSSPTTAPKPISISAITSVSPAWPRGAATTSPPARFIPSVIAERAARRLSRRHRAGHSARHRRDQGIRPRRYRRRGFRVCARSAARSAISKACRSSKRSASWATSWARERSLFIHVTLLPYIPSAGELKTKPTQHSVKELLERRHPAGNPAVPLPSARCRKASARKSRCSAT